MASIATAFAEILGGAIALGMLFHLPLKVGALLTTLVSAGLLAWNSYRRLEKLVVGFVSLIGLGFLAEMVLVRPQWGEAAAGWVVPALPHGAILIVMSVLGAVVMPHNLFLHSEVIQSRKWSTQGDVAIEEHLKFEWLDTLVSMIAGWLINSAMIILAAATFYKARITVTSLEQAQSLLLPLLGARGELASGIFAVALLCAGLTASVTAGMSGGCISAGLINKPYSANERASRIGVAATLGLALAAILFVHDTYRALILSQVVLSVQLPFTIVLLLILTSSRRVMGKYANARWAKLRLWTVAAIVIGLNVLLLRSILAG